VHSWQSTSGDRDSFNAGGSVFLGLSIEHRAFIEAQPRGLTAVESYNFSSLPSREAYGFKGEFNLLTFCGAISGEIICSSHEAVRITDL